MKKTYASKHQCHAPGCREEIPDQKVFCDRHWMMVPKVIQIRFSKTFVIGKPFCPCFGEMTKEYRVEFNEALEAIYRKEMATGGHS